MIIGQFCDKLEQTSIHLHNSYGNNYTERLKIQLIWGSKSIKGYRIILNIRWNTYKNHEPEYESQHEGYQSNQSGYAQAIRFHWLYHKEHENHRVQGKSQQVIYSHLVVMQ